MAEKRHRDFALCEEAAPPRLAGLLVFLAAAIGCGSGGVGAGDGMLGNAGSGGTAGEGGSAGSAGVGGAVGAGGVAGLGGQGGAASQGVVELDPTFGEGGVRIFSLLDGSSSHEEARAVAVMPDGRIVVAGSKRPWTFSSSFGFLTMLDDAGELQSSFGDLGNGHALVAFDVHTEANAVAVDSIGRIVVGGWSKSISFQDQGALSIARFLDDGSLDSSFGNDPMSPGVTKLSEPCAVTTTDLVLDANGRIIATGSACESPERLSAVRLLADGAPDSAFGDEGLLLLEPGYGDEVLISEDGVGATRILVGGSVGDSGFDGNMDFMLSAIRDDGAVDLSFGDSGTAVTDFGDGSPGRSEGLTALAERQGGGFLAAGWAQLISNFEEPWEFDYDVLVAAYDESGALDEAFGSGGYTLLDLGSDTEDAVEVLRRENGNIAVVGQSGARDSLREIAVVHLRPDGAPVGDGHVTLTKLDGIGLTAQAATLDRQGRLLVAGYVAAENDGYDVFVARYVFRDVQP